MKIVIGAALLLACTTASAVPMTFQFTAAGEGVGFNGPAGQPQIVVPAPYNDYTFAFGTPISGSLTVETSTPGVDSYIYEYGVQSPGGKFYDNPLTSFDLNLGGQLFSLNPAQGSSFIYAFDRHQPSMYPIFDYDDYEIDVGFGDHQLGGAFDNLLVSTSLIWSERDLSRITSDGIIDGLLIPSNFNLFFTIYDPTTESNYQLFAPITSITAAPVSVPEPQNSLLFAIAAALTLVVTQSRRRKSA